jgi:hydroxyacyl-ACP dehydratase HTD2-like protein with hotdog domain
VSVIGFSFRGLRPLLANAPFTLGLNPTDNGAELVAIAPDGGAAMSATVEIQTKEKTA